VAAYVPPSLVHRTPATTSRLQAYVLCGPDKDLTCTPDRLIEHLGNLVALGLFPSIDAAKAGCMHNRWLSCLRPWRHMVRVKEAMVVTGGSDEDVLAAMCCTNRWQTILLVCMLRSVRRHVPRLH
jgi:hypothetical protein